MKPQKLKPKELQISVSMEYLGKPQNNKGNKNRRLEEILACGSTMMADSEHRLLQKPYNHKPYSEDLFTSVPFSWYTMSDFQ